MTCLYNSLTNIFQDIMTLLIDFKVVYKQPMCPFDFCFSWLTYSGDICLLE